MLRHVHILENPNDVTSSPPPKSTWPRLGTELKGYSVILHSFDWKSAVEHDGGV